MTLFTNRTRIAAVVLSLSIGGARLAAQQPEGNEQTGLRMGGLNLAPTIQFASGIDTNVFNTWDQPRSDFTWTLTPKTDVALRLGPVRLSGNNSTDFVYFQQSTTERSINVNNTLKVSVPLNRVQPYVSGSFSRTRQRPNFEIDARSLRHERSASLGTVVRLASKTEVDLVATTSTVAFDAGAVFLDTYLRDVFNRTTRSAAMSIRQALTPLTTVTMGVETQEERFTFSALRNSRNLRVVPGFEFASTALISGKASVGYQSFNAIDASVPDFEGLIASVELSYTLVGTTKFQFQASRDINYSFEAEAPYYVQSGLGGGVIQRISDSTGITMRAARYQLDFQSIASVFNDATIRSADTLMIEGGGLLYKIGRDLSMNINVDYYRRKSALFARGYSGLRAGSSVVYGF